MASKTWAIIGQEYADRLSDQIISGALNSLGISQEAYKEGLDDDEYDRLMDETVEMADEFIKGFNEAWFYSVTRE